MAITGGLSYSALAYSWTFLTKIRDGLYRVPCKIYQMGVGCTSIGGSHVLRSFYLFPPSLCRANLFSLPRGNIFHLALSPCLCLVYVLLLS
jgi:hypothetical protein